MKQNNYTEVSGSYFLNIPSEKNLNMGLKHRIQILSNTLEIEICLAPRAQTIACYYSGIIFLPRASLKEESIRASQVS